MYGISTFFVTKSYLNSSKEFCDNYSFHDEVYKDYPELYVWDYCNFKVYPITNGDHISPCNCRGFRLDKDEYLTLNESIFNSKLVESLLTHWFMLQTFQLYIAKDDTNIIVNLTKLQ